MKNRPVFVEPSKALRVISMVAALFLGIASLAQPTAALQNQQARPTPQQTFSIVEVHVLPVQGNLYMLVGAGGNVTLQVGDDGVLVVDTQVSQMTDKILAAIKQLTDKPIRWIVNTHFHPDHTGGNGGIAEAGSSIEENATGTRGIFNSTDRQAMATIVAHENVLKRMSAPTGQQAPAPVAAWPDATFFGDEKEMYFNGDPIQIIHLPAAHTDGDSIVFFRHSDVISAGDVFDTTSYPVIDLKTGGTINGILNALNRIIDITVPKEKQEGGTYVIPGHGRLSDEADVVNYRDMVTIIRDRIQDLIKRGMTLEQVKAAKPTLDYDRRYGATTGLWTTDMFVEAVHRTLTQPAPRNSGLGANSGQQAAVNGGN